jgi:hypothetical protein
MRLSLVIRKAIAWTLGACLVLGAMAPAVSQGLEAHGRGPLGWDAVCTQLAAGHTQRLPQPTAPADHLFNHCPYCAIHLTAWGPPTAPAVPAPTAWAQHRVPQPAMRVVRTASVWVTAQPRGPPAHA